MLITLKEQNTLIVMYIELLFPFLLVHIYYNSIGGFNKSYEYTKWFSQANKLFVNQI